jgi:signal transduction histidine kinase
MMSTNELLFLITQFFFIALGLLTVIDWLRHRTPIRRDIALMFNTLGLPISIQTATLLSHRESLTANFIIIFILIVQPYSLLRLLKHFRQVPHTVERGALLSMLAAWVLLVSFYQDPPPIAGLFVLAYIVIFNAYAMLAFIRETQTAVGVVRRRLWFAALGSGLLAFALLASNIRPVLPALTNTFQGLVQLSAIGAALSYYLGFVPPRRLRRTWQLVEFQQFLGILAQPSAYENSEQVYAQLYSIIPKAIGEATVDILIPDENTDHFIVYKAETPVEANETIIKQVWQSQTPTIAQPVTLSLGLRQRFEVSDKGLMFLVPIVRSKRVWGMLLVTQPQLSLFPDDDLAILSDIAGQIAIILENLDLIETMRQQTAHLEAVNKELEAFSYSVSHDLRAPLRSLDGFSQALLEDFHDQLDDSGRDYFRRVRAASQRMGQLIDDMLKLSQVTQTEVHWETVDLSRMIQNIIADLKLREVDRHVEVIIEDQVQVQGDTQLLRIMLENLIGNAWKFTRQKSDARIEFGRTIYRDQPVFYLRDNGAGFDMTYATKLFGAFQRLHNVNEFEGTGIGLATTQRVVNRHGGLIWAEGIVNQGATFYFKI